jgi:UDP-glucose 4-epimerase
MTVLVTGAAGYIGSHMCVALLNGGYDVAAADNFSNSSMEALRRVKKITGKEPKFYEADVRDEAAADKIFAENKIECVIHFAGLKAVAVSVAEPEEYYSHNLNATLTVCRQMQKYGVRRIVFSSSATVYKAGNKMPLTEDAETGECSSPYGWTKYIGEQMIRDIAATNGWSAVFLRYFNVAGAHESGLIGDDPSGVPNNIMPYISQVAVGRREFLPLTGTDYPTPDGTCVRDYIHVTDLANGHLAAVGYTENHKGAEAFNLGTGRGTSTLELINSFARVNGIPVPYKACPRRPGDLPVSYSDASKAKELLGWAAVKTVDDICADTWRWQKNNPNGLRG